MTIMLHRDNKEPSVRLVVKHRTIFLSFYLTTGCSTLTSVAGINFEETLLPVIQEKCFRCHSGRIETPGGELQFDDAQLFKKGSKYGEVLIPDLHATIGHAMGMPIKKVIMSGSGRPFNVGYKGNPVADLI